MAATINTQVSRTSIEDKLKKFDNIITVAKTGHGDFVCSDAVYASDDQCIQAALDYISSLGGGHLHVLAGRYICTAQLLYRTGNILLTGDGNNTILDFSTATSFLGCISITGSISSTNSLLSSDVTAGNQTIVVADGTKFSADDWIRIRSETIFQPTSDNTWTQTMGELQKIQSIDGNTLTLQELLCGSYTTSGTATIDFVNMIENVTIKDIKLIGNPAQSQYGINISQAYNVTVKNIHSTNMIDRAVKVKDCVNVKYLNNTILHSNKAGLGYGLAIMDASRNIFANNNDFLDCRHGITWGGTHKYGVQYNIICTNNIQSHDTQKIGMFGPHPSASGVTISSNVCNGCGLGFISCINGTVNNNIVLNTNPNLGYASFQFGKSCQNVTFSNNLIIGVGTGLLISTEYDTIKVDNNILICTGTLGDAVPINITKVNTLQINNNIVNGIHTAIMFDNLTEIKDSANISIRGNSISTQGTAGIYINGNTYNIKNITIENNDITTTNTGVGIYIAKNDAANGVNSSVILANNSCTGSAIGIQTKYTDKINIENNKVNDALTGIKIDTGSTDYLLDKNDVRTCTTKIRDTVNDVNRLINHNYGYNTENMGTATITASASYVTVTHGMAATPTKIVVTPFGNVGNCWITDAGATTFQINVSSAPASDTLISWSAAV